MKKTSIFENGLVWFGAGVSIAEIITGTYLASLGFNKGLLAIIIGHIIGGILLFLAGVMGAKTSRSSMETVKMSFGQNGSLLFSIINIIQLLGWTSIMIYDGALAADGVFDIRNWIWCILIGGLVILWVVIGLKNLGKINTVAMVLLFALTLILSYIIFFKGTVHNIGSNGITFGAAIELSIAMPLSWLPLISDYTKEAEKPIKATAVSAIVYGLASSWMYIIGMGAAIFTAESDIAQILLKAGLGVAGLIIVVFATVTTTFLDAFSAGISSESISSRINGKTVAIIITVLGTIGAICLPLHDITAFLYFLGSVFAPMIAILITNFYILKKDNIDSKFSFTNMISWAIGFIVYRLLMNTDMVLGYTIPSMLITMILCLIVTKITDKKLIKKKDR